MTRDLKQLWQEAYKLSHVLADLTEKAEKNPDKADPEWLADSARELNSIAVAIHNQSKGIKREGVSFD